MVTLEELCQRLCQFDEVSLMEFLDVHSDDLVERFKDRIEERFDELCAELEESVGSTEE